MKKLLFIAFITLTFLGNVNAQNGVSNGVNFSNASLGVLFRL